MAHGKERRPVTAKGESVIILTTETIGSMMTSSNGNIFRITGHLCGEFTGPGEFPTQRPVTRNFDVYFDLRPNKRLSKQLWGWWFETPSRPLWRHLNALSDYVRPWGRQSLHISTRLRLVLRHWGRKKMAAILLTTYPSSTDFFFASAKLTISQLWLT